MAELDEAKSRYDELEEILVSEMVRLRNSRDERNKVERAKALEERVDVFQLLLNRIKKHIEDIASARELL